MKKGFGLTLIFLVFLLPTSTLAFQNEPDGFRGIEWGTDISERSDMSRIEENLYKRKNDKLTIGNANVKLIAYMGYKGKLMAVVVTYEGFSNNEKIQQTFFQLYGKGYKPNRFMERYSWFGNDVQISLTYSEINREGRIGYYYRPLWEEKEKEMKEAAKKGADDL